MGEVRQVDWSSPNRRTGIMWSTSGGCYRRFSITPTSSGYTVCDHQTGDLQRTTTLALARAWAGQRVGEKVVRRS